MEFLILALLLLYKKDGEKNSLTPIINALIENKEVMNALIKAVAGAGGEQSAASAEQKNSAPEERENGDGNRAEAIEKFLNGYFK